MPKRITTKFKEAFELEVEVNSEDVANALAGAGDALASSMAQIKLGHIHATNVTSRKISGVRAPRVESVRVEAPRVGQRVPLRIQQEQ